MKKESKHKNLANRSEDTDSGNNPEEYPLYPASEDIYSIYQKEKNIDPEDISEIKKNSNTGNSRTSNGNDFYTEVSGSDLDVPGSELDDEQEMIGSEDEENNYYSLGGDEHNDLDEDNG